MRRFACGAIAGIGMSAALFVGVAVAPVAAEPTATPSASAELSPSPSVTTQPSDPATAAALAAPPTPPAPRRKRKKPTRDVEKTLADIQSGRARLVVGDTGAAVSAVQTRLNVAGIKTRETGVYSSDTAKAVRHLQWKYLIRDTGQVDSGTYRKLVEITGGKFQLPKACRSRKTRIIICIDLEQRILRYVRNGTPKFVIDIRSGRSSQPTRRGHWRVFSKSTYVWSSLYQSPMPYSMFFSGGQAIHYSMYFNADGYYGASHGCVNVGSMVEARWLYRNTPMGTPVVVY